MSQTEVQLIKDAVIVNADVSNSAAIDVSKLSGVMPSAGGTFSGAVTVTGDVDSTTGIFERTTGFTSQLKFTDSNETKLVHGSNGQVKLSFVGVGNAARGSIDGQSGFIRMVTATGDTGVICRDNSSTDLRFNDSTKLETTNTGVLVSGSLTADGGNAITLGDSKKIVLGTGSDLEIYHDGNHSYIADTGTGNLRILTSSTFTVNNAANSQNMILATDGGSVELFNAGNKKIETTSVGVTTTGRVKLDVNSSTVFPTSFGNEAFTPYDHELVIDNNTGGNEGSFAGIFFNAGADTDGSKVGTARITAVETGNYKADLIFSTRNTSFTQKMRIKAAGQVLIGSTDGATYADSSNDDLIVGSTANGKNDGITILSGTAQNGTLAFADSGGTTRGLVGYVHNGDYLRLHAGNTLKVRIDTDGLKFNSDTAAANALDDYEEGTFTPTATFESSDDGNKAYSTQSGSYTKIGRLVHCNIVLVFSNRGTGSGRLRFNSLPFTVGDNLSGTILEASAIVGYFAGLVSSVSDIKPVAIQGTDQIVFYGVLGQYGTSTDDFGYSHVGNAFSIRMSITYQV